MQVILINISAISFIVYGLLCLFTNHMEEEFKRYGLSRFRHLAGALEVLGGFGQILGLYFNPLLTFSSSGLAFLMLLGVIVRLKTKDPLFEIIPAFILMIVNVLIVYSSLLS